MANIYEELKSLISKDMISKMAKGIGASSSHVTDAVHQIVPTMLAKFMGKSDSSSVHSLLEDAGKLDLHNVGNLFGSNSAKHNTLGEKFVSTIMGSQEGALTSMISSKEGLNADHSKKLITTIGGVMAGFLGSKALHGGTAHLMDQLKSEKTSILSGVPASWKDKLGISAEGMHCAIPGHVAHHETAHRTAAAHTPGHTVKHTEHPKKKGGMGWLLWLLLAILLLLLLWWLLGKGCTGCAKKEVVVPVVETVVPLPATTYDLTLANGEKLTVPKGSMVDKMIMFLRSDQYKNATDADLSKHWFEFDRIDFAFNSSTEYVEDSRQNIKNIAFVMKYFPEAKIRIGGNADVKGREAYNMPLSMARAETIKNHLVEDGVMAARVSTQGFGDEKAVIPATSTDAERAPDRDIAFRFTK